MSDRNPENQCPAGMSDCPVSAEVAQLREQCSRLEALSYIDALTGLYNFRYFQRAIEMEMERTRRTMLPTSLIMADLDHFKDINTAYGHEAGNTILSWVGKMLRESTRVIDIPCRYGGEEFALILPSTSLVQSSKIAERLRVIIDSNPALLNETPVPVTASFGVASFNRRDDLTISEFISKADSLLYHAKYLGRNRVCSQEPASIIPETGVGADEKELLFGRGEDETKTP